MLRRFFYLHKSDRRVILLLTAVVAVALAVIFITDGREQPVFANSEKDRGASGDDTLTVITEKLLQAFDPNTADSSTLRRVGLSERLVRNIFRYREAGGVFQTKEDFARLYGLTVGQYRELEPYISIAAEFRPAATLFPRQERTHSYTSRRYSDTDSASVHRYPTKLMVGETIELSTADTTLLQRVPGIGPYFARAIVNYGRRLGGYVRLEQLDEIENFPSEAKDFFTLTPVVTTKLNVNTLTLEQLKRHPYLNFYQARAITDYRRQHGPINDLSELRLLPEFTSEELARLQPYVEY